MSEFFDDLNDQCPCDRDGHFKRVDCQCGSSLCKQCYIDHVCEFKPSMKLTEEELREPLEMKLNLIRKLP